MTTIRKQIQQWREGLLAPNQNDVLFNLISDKSAFKITANYHEENIFSIEENALLKRFYQQHQQHIKETGSPIFGIAKDKIIFELKDKQFEMPFLLADASIQRNRFNNTYQLQQTEDFYLNPLLLKTLAIEELSFEIKEAGVEMEKLGLKINTEEGIWVANFHPHRFVLQKEFDELLAVSEFSEPLKRLFQEEVEDKEVELSEHFLFPADESQRAAMEKVKHQNLVIQGPPGTGKSQVIANLIGKALGVEKSALLVAEKSVALQVIYDQLEKKNLHHFCVLYHHELKSKHFISSLRNTWGFIEDLEQKHCSVNPQSELAKQGLSLTLERLRQEELIGGISFSEFKKHFQKEVETNYLSIKPTIPVWEKDKATLVQLIDNKFPVFGAWKTLKSERYELSAIDKAIQNSLRLLESSEQQKLTVKELQQQLKLGGIVSLFYHNDTALPLDIFEAGSKKQKQFLKLYNEFKTLTEKEELLKAEEKNWDKSFSLTELQEFLSAVSTTNKYNLRFWTTRKKLSKFTDLNLLDAKKALENLVELHTVRKDLIKVKEQLRKNKLPDEIAVLNHIRYVIERLEAVDNNDIQLLFNLKPTERLKIKNSVQELTEIQQYIRSYFNFTENKEIFERLKEIQAIIPLLAENNALISSISQETKSVLAKSVSIEEAETIVFNSHWKDFKGQFPELAKTTSEELESKVRSIISTFQQATNEFSEVIQQQIKTKFEKYHTLLQTPARKLSEEEKKFKAELRKGKSILVKAFNKKRVFPSVRELLESEAKHWIQLLHPVFLCSPYSLAKSLPIDFTFDLAIFDEASQIPLSHTVGGIQRAKRVVISGDQQQMAPQFYFQKSEHQQSDVLHHASFYWDNALLTHHYRSSHPSLIAYSNRYFYENKLKTFPRINPSEPIELITTDGLYIERTNEKEADIIADIVSKKIKNKEFDFGLVAFSQAQLNAILQKIPTNLLRQLEDKNEVFLQSLENVQGDQCEHLIISFGYGKNENGEFHNRFGPLNQEQGHRRLNVLMSRAKEKITFVRSVTSADFSISSNEGVEHLRKLMVFLESGPSQNATQELPASIIQEGNTLKVSNSVLAFESAQQLVDFYSTSTERGWEVKIGI